MIYSNDPLDVDGELAMENNVLCGIVYYVRNEAPGSQLMISFDVLCIGREANDFSVSTQHLLSIKQKRVGFHFQKSPSRGL